MYIKYYLDDWIIYKNSSSNFKRKKGIKEFIEETNRVYNSHLSLYFPRLVSCYVVTSQHFHHRDFLNAELMNQSICNHYSVCLLFIPMCAKPPTTFLLNTSVTALIMSGC